jgi:glycosyltransferase involved in cell wall biosynthesis
MPKISVIIPCHNYGKFVKEAVQSVLLQTFHDFEIIIVNDGSTDDFTLKVLKEIKEAHPEILIIDQKNGHLSNARNSGIKASKGEFVLPLDADDIIEPTMLEKCLDELKKDEKLGLVYTYVRLFGNIDEIWERPEYDLYELLQGNYIVATSLIRKKAWEDVGGYDENMKNGYEDWDFYIRLGKNGWYGKLIKETLFCYRKHGKSMIEDTIKKHDLNVEYIKTKHADIYNDKKMAEIKDIWDLKKLKRLNEQKDLEIIGLNEATQQMQKELDFVKSSKFWKLRNFYLKLFKK